MSTLRVVRWSSWWSASARSLRRRRHSPTSGCRTRRTRPGRTMATNTVYNPTPTNENGHGQGAPSGHAFTLAWTTKDRGTRRTRLEHRHGLAPGDEPRRRRITDWSPPPPPANFPILCASTDSCGEQPRSSTLLQHHLGQPRPGPRRAAHRGATWTATGGATNDVAATSTYVGHGEGDGARRSRAPSLRAKVAASITQAGALGDPYGSGVRTIWWVYGVGPVKIEFQHAGGSSAPVTTSVLQTTNLKAKPLPPRPDYFPLEKGRKGDVQLDEREAPEEAAGREVRRRPGRERLRALQRQAACPGRSAAPAPTASRTRPDGVTSISGDRRRRPSLAKFPPLGPKRCRLRSAATSSRRST